MMTNIKIVTDDVNVWFGKTTTDMGRIPHTRRCIEQVSDEMYNAMMEMSSDERHINTICTLLYHVLCQKGQSNN